MKLILNEDLFQDVPSGPEEGVETTIADMLITAINDEWKTIQYYNSLIGALKQAGQEDMIPVIEDINNEEHKHVGQLQECLKQISPNTTSIMDGENEGSQQLHNGEEQLKEEPIMGMNESISNDDLPNDIKEIVQKYESDYTPRKRDKLFKEIRDKYSITAANFVIDLLDDRDYWNKYYKNKLQEDKEENLPKQGKIMKFI